MQSILQNEYTAQPAQQNQYTAQPKDAPNKLLPVWTKEFDTIPQLKEKPKVDMREISMKEWQKNMNDNTQKPNIIDYERDYAEGINGNPYKKMSDDEHKNEVLKQWDKNLVKPTL